MVAFPAYIVSLRQPTHICKSQIDDVNILTINEWLAKLGEDAIGKPDLGGPWTLVNQKGDFISSTDLKGKYQLLYFGMS